MLERPYRKPWDAVLSRSWLDHARVAALRGRVYDYNQSAPLDVKVTKTELREGVEVRDITFANTSGGRTAAYLVVPTDEGAHPAALMVHWYAPEEHDSNRTQYLGQAVEFAKLGSSVYCPKPCGRSRTGFRHANAQTTMTHRFAASRNSAAGSTCSWQQPDVDKKRVAFVGHDFGAMYGAILITADKRPTLYALQAFTNEMSHWYLYGPKMPEPDRSQFIAEAQAAGCDRASQPCFSRSRALAVRND